MSPPDTSTLPALPAGPSRSPSPAPNSPPPSPRKSYLSLPRPAWRLTLFGRCFALLAGEFLANAVVWIAAACVWGPDPEKRGVLSLAVVAWTLGLRHGLDMDHIVAVDNATRSLVAMGQTPVTVGLFFSLGHSTIVIAMTVAVIITTAAIDKLPDVASIGGVIGVSVSASFLFLLAVINSVMLWQTVRVARKRKQLRAAAAHASNAPLPDAPAPDSASDAHILSKKLSTTSDASRVLDEEASIAEAKRQEQEAERDTMPGLPATTCIGRIGRPLFRMINRPWKMYPVGVLFGLGFDTASEISLLGISALASAGPHKIPAGEIILLPLLFTAGMTAVDSLDSVFMLTAYTVPQRAAAAEEAQSVLAAGEEEKKPWYRRVKVLEARPSEEDERQEVRRAAERARMLPQADEDKLLNISVVLTVISIVVALLISITEFMGLALEKCAKCSDAADNDPGLAGRWWRFWAAVNDNSGYLGAGVVGLFLVVFLGWGGVHLWNKRKEKREGKKAAIRI